MPLTREEVLSRHDGPGAQAHNAKQKFAMGDLVRVIRPITVPEQAGNEFPPQEVLFWRIDGSYAQLEFGGVTKDYRYDEYQLIDPTTGYTVGWISGRLLQRADPKWTKLLGG